MTFVELDTVADNDADFVPDIDMFLFLLDRPMHFLIRWFSFCVN